MYWKDLFYFSKAEKQAVGILFVLIVLAVLLVLFKKDPATATIEEQQIIRESITSMHQADKTTPPKQVKLSKPNVKHTQTPQTVKNAPSTKKQPKKQWQNNYHTQNKYPKGTIIALNHADTLELKQIPGIASTYANRIVKFRNLLGGFYTVQQLQEVYGMTDERYQALKEWFSVDSSLITPLAVNHADFKTLNRHPYITYEQTKALVQLRKQYKNQLKWVNIQLLEEFSPSDLKRLKPYLSFD